MIAVQALVFLDQVGGQFDPSEIVRVGITRLAQGFQFAAPFRDDMVFVLGQLIVRHGGSRGCIGRYG